MHLSATFVFFAAALVASQSIPNIPQCSLNCFTTILTTDGCTSITDFGCHCQKQSLATTLTNCVQAACSESDQQAVLATVQDTCKQAGHPITVAIPSSTQAGSPTSGSSSKAPTKTSSTKSSSTGTVIGGTNTALPYPSTTARPSPTESNAVTSAEVAPTSATTGAANALAVGHVGGAAAGMVALVAWLL